MVKPFVRDTHRKLREHPRVKAVTEKFVILRDGWVIPLEDFAALEETLYLVVLLTGCSCPARHPDSRTIVSGVEVGTVFGPVGLRVPELGRLCPTAKVVFEEAMTEEQAATYGLFDEQPAAQKPEEPEKPRKPGKPKNLDDTTAFEQKGVPGG